MCRPDVASSGNVASLDVTSIEQPRSQPGVGASGSSALMCSRVALEHIRCRRSRRPREPQPATQRRQRLRFGVQIRELDETFVHARCVRGSAEAAGRIDDRRTEAQRIGRVVTEVENARAARQRDPDGELPEEQSRFAYINRQRPATR